MLNMLNIYCSVVQTAVIANSASKQWLLFAFELQSTCWVWSIWDLHIFFSNSILCGGHKACPPTAGLTNAFMNEAFPEGGKGCLETQWISVLGRLDVITSPPPLPRNPPLMYVNNIMLGKGVTTLWGHQKQRTCFSDVVDKLHTDVTCKVKQQ